LSGLAAQGASLIGDEEKHDIKLIALDLDGTTLDAKGQLTDRTKKTLEEAIRRGIILVIATGRAYSALPEEIFSIEGIRYIVTSNGACVTDIIENELVYSNCIEASALEAAVETLRKYNFMLEVFVEGRPYVEKSVYENVPSMNLKEKHKRYIMRTREPVEGLLEFALWHKDLVENINVNFEDQENRSMMRGVLGQLENVTLTTSFDHNLELGGATTSKADAVRVICEKFGIHESQVMACGDSPNDTAMLRAAGLPVAVENAKDELKEIARYVTKSNDEDGVAMAIERLAL